MAHVYRRVLVLGALLAALLLTEGSWLTPEPVLATPVDRATAQNGAVQVYLPLLGQWYDPFYVAPGGVVMYGNVDDSHGLSLAAAAGGQWITTSFVWSAVEPSNNTFDWSSFDAKAQNAQAAGQKLLVLFTGNPAWAAELPGGPVYNLDDLVDISRRMAERYDCDGAGDAPGSPCVHDWSFYAEPDNGDRNRALAGWGYWGHNPAGYAAMISRVAPAVHAANHQARVLTGGLAYDYFEEDGGPFVRAFLGSMLSALSTYPGGVGAYLDGLAFHYYPVSTQRWPSIREKALEVRGSMSLYGAGSLPLVCPEAGYWSSPNFGSSENRQAERLAQMYVRSMSVEMRPLVWYRLYDTAWAEGDTDLYPDRTSGLLRVDGSIKPAYLAMQTLNRELGHSYYRRVFSWANTEGYVFQVAPAREMTVLWAKVSAVDVSFPGTCLRRVYLLGYAEPVTDGSAQDRDGQVNGQVTLRIEQDKAQYIEPCH